MTDIRVWDRFLTERDKQHLALGWQKTEPFGLGARAALVVIDNWTTVVGDGPEDILEVMSKSSSHCGVEGWEAVQRTRTLLEAARRRGMFVVHTTVKDPVATAIFARSAGGIGEPAFEFHRDCSPDSGELVITKSYASAFLGTSLSAHLVTRGIDTIVVCGNSTSGCVRATVVDAAGGGFHVGVVEECVFDRTEASHAINLFDMDQKYADVISYDAALLFIEEQVAVEPRNAPA